MHDDRTVVPGLENEPVFAEPWQAQAFAMTVALHESGTFAWSEWAAMLGAEIKGEADYWTAWLRTLEKMMAERNVATPTELDARTEAWREAAEATPHGEPIILR